MKSFKDTEGRDWAVSLNVTLVKKVRAALNIDLMKVGQGDGQLITQLATDPELLVNVLYVLCKDQVDKRSLSDEQFGEGFGGDAIEQAVEAFLEALADFFPSGRRTLLKQATAKIQELDGALLANAGAELATLNVQQVLAEAKRAAAEPSTAAPQSSGDSSTSTPASSASTPDLSVSAS